MLVERLRELREQQGLTQVELAAKSGLNEMTVTRLEAGQRIPRQRTLDRLAAALGTTVEYLTGADLREEHLAALAVCLEHCATDDIILLAGLARRLCRSAENV